MHNVDRVHSKYMVSFMTYECARARRSRGRGGQFEDSEKGPEGGDTSGAQTAWVCTQHRYILQITTRFTLTYEPA